MPSPRRAVRPLPSLLLLLLLLLPLSACAQTPLPPGGETPTDGSPSTPAPDDPAPTDPDPTDPAPGDPDPTDPKPDEPAPPPAEPPTAAPRVLVFSKTAGFRHDSIPAGLEAMHDLTSANDLEMYATEDAAEFTDDRLAGYHAVVFLNTTGDVLDAAQQEALKRFVASGRGFVGVHAATDTEKGWKWYERLVGAVFDAHPRVQEGEVRVVAADHPATRHLPDPWRVRDEFYSFRDVQPDLQVLLELDESSYDLGNAPSMGDAHPAAWWHEVDGGRAFYTALGHTPEIYADADFRQHLLGGLLWALGGDRPPED